MPSVPSVTMNGSMRPLVISKPCASPNTAPSSSAKTMPMVTTTYGELIDVLMPFISRIIAPAISAAIEPTDRSMPPEMMTKVMPTAMMPMKAVRVSTFRTLSAVAKSGLSAQPAMHSRTRPSSGPRSWMRCTSRPDWPADVSAVVLVSTGGMSDQLLFG